MTLLDLIALVEADMYTFNLPTSGLTIHMNGSTRFESDALCITSNVKRGSHTLGTVSGYPVLVDNTLSVNRVRIKCNGKILAEKEICKLI